MNKKINIYKKENFSGLPFAKGLTTFMEPLYFSKLLSHEKKLGITEDNNHTYQYNSSGFRCDEFTENHNGRHILFAGCSETEGMAHRLENTWAHKVYSKISENEKCSGFFNVGARALNIIAINRQILNYISKYGKPDILFINYPDFYRFSHWNEEKLTWEPKWGLESLASYNLKDKFFLRDFKDAQINDTESFLIDNNFNEEIQSTAQSVNGKLMIAEYMSDERNSDYVVHSIQNFMIMEQICKIMGISLFWGTWDQYGASTIRQSGLFKSYVDIGNLKNNYKWAEENGYTAKDVSARDIGHMGVACHGYWAEQFLDTYQEINNK